VKNCAGQARNLAWTKIIIGRFVEDDPDKPGFGVLPKPELS
jgi:hypothetical protein